jgi:protein SCO1
MKPIQPSLVSFAFCAILVFGGWMMPRSATAQNLPPLAFSMTRASDGKPVTAADYRGKIVLLYFGYTFCPDICPTTLLNLTNILKSLGKAADGIRVLFVTVDPGRDTLPVLKTYVDSFAPQIVGLRGTPQELAAFAGRYHAPYSVTPAHDGKPYEVTHGASIYVFDGRGKNVLTFLGLAAPNADLKPIADYLQKLMQQSGGNG